MADERFGIYFLPAAGSGLAAFGASWLGWDVETGTEAAHPEVPLDVAAVTATPRVYGFHGTVKPPFRLAEGADRSGLEEALAAVAGRHAAAEMPVLKLSRLGHFLALTLSTPSEALARLAEECVTGLDSFRAPATEAELAKRRAAGLSPRQDELLVTWGYPYVLDEFRFHLTLSGRLDPTEIDAVEAELARLTAPYTQDPLPLTEICLVHQVDGAPFRLLHRYPLTG